MSVTGVLVLLTRTSWLPVLAALLFAASFNNRQAVAGPFATAAASHSADARRRFHVQSPPDYFDVDQNERAIVIDATSWRIVAPLAGGGDFGSDPLDPYGGVFEQWKREDRKQTRYVSELVEGAYVGWSDLEVQTTSRDDHGNVKANFTVAFPVEQVNARLLSEFFGKGGLRWSGWVVGEFHVTQATTAEFLLSGVRQFFVDDIDSMHVGDPYGQGLARVTVPLSSGRHTLFLPIYGSADRPLEIHVEMTSIAEGNVLRYMPDDVLLPDAVDGRLASPYVSVVVQNSGQLPLVNLTAILRSGEQEANVIVTALPAIAPGQILPLVLFADTGYDYRQAGNCSDQLRVVIRSRDDDRLLLATSLSIRCKQFGDAYRFTFLDFDGSVQKAAARPPPEPCTAYGNTTVDGCPVLFTTHGAGVEADGDAWVGAYRPQRHAWILFPSNRRSYGYDWEGPGMMNGAYALAYLKMEQPGVAEHLKPNYMVDATRRLYAGHSMGGHGCLVYATLQPDYGVAAACASGWIRRELYVSSLQYAAGMSRIDRMRAGYLQTSLDEYSVDLHLRNMAGMPVLLRMGSADDTVPAWGLRRIARMLTELGHAENMTEISEIAGGGHWFDGIVNDDIMQSFFDRHLSPESPRRPSLPSTFVLTTMNPATFQGKGGIRILQLDVPFRIATIAVKRTVDDARERWTIRTSNVQRFGFYILPGLPFPSDGVRIDGSLFSGPVETLPRKLFCKVEEGWKVCEDTGLTYLDRNPMNYGPARQVLETAPLTIVYSAKIRQHYDEALYLANALYFQGRYAPVIIPDTEFRADNPPSRNLIVLGSPNSNAAANYIHSLSPKGQLVHFDQQPDTNRFSFSLYRHDEKRDEDVPIVFSSLNHGILYLAPWTTNSTSGGNGIALIVAGNSLKAFRSTVRRLMPLTSNVMMGDFAVVDASRLAWQGMGGIVGYGFWSNEWRFDERTGFIDTSLVV